MIHPNMSATFAVDIRPEPTNVPATARHVLHVNEIRALYCEINVPSMYADVHVMKTVPFYFGKNLAKC